MTVLIINFYDDGNDQVFKQHITGGTFGEWRTLQEGHGPHARNGELKELISCFIGISMSVKGSHRQIRMLRIMGRRTPSQVLQYMLVGEPDLMPIFIQTMSYPLAVAVFIFSWFCSSRGYHSFGLLSVPEGDKIIEGQGGNVKRRHPGIFQN